MTISKRVRTIALWLGGLLLLYAAVGFLAVPALVKHQLVRYVEQDLGHQLSVGKLKLNPFTLAAEATNVELREPSGAPLAGFERLFVNFQASSLFRRIWTFDTVELASPKVNFELRPDGSVNFDALLAKFHQPSPEPESEMSRIEIGRVLLTEGRIDLADLQAGPQARLRLEPIAFELQGLSTLPKGHSPYQLTARTPEGETLQWGGEVALNPMTSTGKLALGGWKVATLTRLLGRRIDLHDATGQIDIAFDYRAGYSEGAASFSVSNAELMVDALSLIGRKGAAPLAAVQRFAVGGGSFDLARRSLALERVDLNEARFALEIDTQGNVNWAALAPQPISAQVQSTSGQAVPAAPTEPAAATTPGATATAPAEAAAPWTFKVGQIHADELQFVMVDLRPGSERSVSIKRAKLGLSVSAESRHEATSALLENLTLAAGNVAVVRAHQKGEMHDAVLAASRVRWDPHATGTQLTFSGTKLSMASHTVALDDQSWRLEKPAAEAEVLALDFPTDAYRAMRLELAGLQIESPAFGGGVGAKNEPIQGSDLRLATKSLALAMADPVDVTIAETTLNLGRLLVRDPASGDELARFGKAEAKLATVSTLDRQVNLEKVAVSDGHLAALLSPNGKTNWDGLVSAFVPASSTTAPSPATQSSPWKMAVKAVDLNNFSGVFSDRRQANALTINFLDVNGRLRDASTTSTTPAGVELSGRLKEGGQFRAGGNVHLQTFASDLKLKLTELSLLPLQYLLAQHARLKIVSALASADGRLRYGKVKEAGGQVVFEGELGLDKVDIEETEPAQPFLAFDSMRALQVKLSLEPNALDIPDLRVNRLATKIIIAEDQSLNLLKVLRNPPPAETTPPAGDPKTAPAADDDEPPFAVSLARIRLDNSIVQFADLSLRPQFSARMHELKGVITGVSTSRDRRASVELQARVDEFGAAQIQGSINPFRPRRFTSIDMDFRNIEMTSLTPYTAKFAGYRIASGKLAASLQYRIKNSALQGSHKIVIDKLELGERVESPTALDLPLELAIALLKDDNDRIDIGLEVSGSLEDPQFSIAALVWKAIGNLLGRIVTAPFRALGRLFGGGADPDALGLIEFDPGMDGLRPPEKQKLRTIAEALSKRPKLSLTIKPAYSPSADGRALQSVAARRAVLTQAGIKLEADESPGPLDYGNTRIQRAIETVFTNRFGLPAARDLRASLAKRASTSQESTATDTAVAESPRASEAPPGAGVAPHDAPRAEGSAPTAGGQPSLAAIRVARAMSERLIEGVTVSDTELAALGGRRGRAIAEELKADGKVEPSRVTTVDPHTVEATRGPIVTDLDLAVAK